MTPDLRLFGFAAGVWGASIAALWVRPATAVAIAITAGAIAAVVWRRGPAGLIVAGLALGAVAGAASTAARTVARDAEPLAGMAAARSIVEADLTVAGDPRPLDAGSYLVPARLTRVDDLRLAVSVVVFADEAWRDLLPGQRLTATGRLGPARGGDLTAATFAADGASALVGSVPWVQRAAGSLRAGLRNICATLPPEPGGLLPGLIIGDTSALVPAVKDEFRATGLTHLLAVSGANVAIIIAAVLFLVRWCRAGPWLAATSCAVALVGFVVLVRPSPSVVRAAAMGAVVLLALATGRPRVATAALATAVVAGLLYDPALAVDPGFALSVAATAGLVLLAPRWRDGLRQRGVPPGLAEAIAIAAAAQVACGPIIVALSGEVSLVAIPANLLAVPAVPVATVLGVAATVLSPLWTDGAIGLVWLAQWPARWLILVADRGAALPGGAVAWPGGLVGALVLAALTLAVLVAVRRRAGRTILVVTAVGAVIGAAPVRWLAAGWPPEGTVIVACDVGQGDALVLPTGPGEAVVVDAGPDPSAVDGCLRRLGISTVAVLVVSHFHADHVGGVEGVLRGRRVGAVVVPAFAEPVGGERSVRAAAVAAPVLEVGPGWTYARGGLVVRVIGPPHRLTGTRSDPNNNSLIVRVEVAGPGLAVLLLGDAEIEEQQALLDLDPAWLRADVVKVAHHGSSYQDLSLITRVRPRVALVSVGADNSYGHPQPSLLAHLERAGARVMRTDEQGDLAVAVGTSGLVVAARGR